MRLIFVVSFLIGVAQSNNCSIWRSWATQTAQSVMTRPWTDINQGIWSSYWWKSANALETISDYMTYNRNHDYQTIYNQLYQNGGSFINYYYDDEGWWGISWLKAYERTKDIRFLNLAKSIHQDISGGWDNTCGGGLWWSKARTYKNAIPNELFLVLSTRLYFHTQEQSYRDWAEKEWNWFASSGMINSQNLINDGLTNDCKNNGQNTWTYNQGVILGGLQELYGITKNASLIEQAQKIADAAMSHLRFPDGVLQESCDPNESCGSDGAEFKGVFVRYLGQLYSSVDTQHRRSIAEFMNLNVNSLWNRARGNGVNFAGSWEGPFQWNNDVTINLPRTQVALDAFNAVIEINDC